MEKNVNEQIERIKKRVLDKDNLSRDLHIMRVPIKTFEIFKEKSAAFAGDYGMLLKWMVDKLFVDKQEYEHIIEVINESLIPSITDLNERVEALESVPEKKTFTRKSIDGKIRKE